MNDFEKELNEKLAKMENDQKTFVKELNKLIVPQGYDAFDLSDVSDDEYDDITEMSAYYGAKEYAQIYFKTRY